MKTCRHQFLLLVLFKASCAAALAQSPSILPELRGDYLQVSATAMHMLAGRPMEKLQNGSSVTYLITLAAFAAGSNKPAAVVREKFAFSYDLWEERFSIVQSGKGGRSVSRLSAPLAEQWCMENMKIPLRSIPERQPFILKLECSIEKSRESTEERNHPTLTLAGLIDVFGRKNAEEPFRLTITAGPFRLGDLRLPNPSQR